VLAVSSLKGDSDHAAANQTGNKTPNHTGRLIKSKQAAEDRQY